MSETNPETTTTVPTTEPETTEPATLPVAPPAPGAPSTAVTVPAVVVPKDADESVATGYAVYDKSLGQFVSGVVDTKAAADKLRKDGASGHELVTRRV